MKEVALVILGQSNFQGAARSWVGGPSSNRERFVSRSTKETDPFPGCNNSNQGGSLLPYLIDMGYDRGVRYRVFNYAIGGASVFFYTGRVGGTVVGSATVPASVGFFSGGEYVGGTTPCVEGNADFDPFGLLSRTRDCINSLRKERIPIVCAWSNGESDAGSSSASYQAGLTSVTNYLLASGVSAVLVGLSCKNYSASAANYNLLEAGRAATVTTLRNSGQPVYDGGNGWLYWGETPPMYPESDAVTYVHLTLPGQRVHASLWNTALENCGY